MTRERQWVSTSLGIDLLDMPGMLWPKFDERLVGENLAITGAIRDSLLDREEIAIALIVPPSQILSRAALRALQSRAH